MGSFSNFLMGLSNSTFSVIGSLLTRTLSGMTGLLRSMLGRITQLFASLPRLVLGAFGHLADGVRGAFGAVAGALKYSLYGLVGLVGGAVALLGKSIQTASTWGRSLSSLSASTGLSARAAGGLSSRLGAVGLDASIFAGKDPAMSALRNGAAFGIGGFANPQFMAQAAGRFQQLNAGGLDGRMMARQLAKSNGLDNDAGYRALSTPVGQIREQQRFAGGVRGSLGLDDGAIVKVGRDFDLLSGKLKVLGESVLLKIGQEALPRINAGFDKILQFAESKAGGIGGLISRGVDAGFQAFAKLALFLADTAPRAALTFASSMLQGLLAVTTAIPDLFTGLLKGVDVAQMGFNFLAQTGASALDLLTRGISSVSAGVGAFIQQLPQIGTMLSGVWDTIRNGINGLLPGLIPGGGGSAGQLGDNTRGLPGFSNPNASPYTSPEGVVGAAWNTSRFLTAPGGWAGRQAAHAVGADAPWQQGIADLAGRSAMGGALVAGGRVLLATPIGRVTQAAVGAAGAVGYAGFSGAQALGVVDRDQSFAERLGLGASRLADLATGNWGATDNRANERWALERAQANGRLRGHPMAGDNVGQLGASARAIGGAALNGWNNPTTPDFAGLMRQSFNAAPQGSWSKGLEGRFGDDIRRGSGNASESIGRALAELEKQKEGLGSNEILALLRDLADAAKGTERNTSREKEKPLLTDHQVRLFAQTVGQQLSGRARADYMRLVSG